MTGADIFRLLSVPCDGWFCSNCHISSLSPAMKLAFWSCRWAFQIAILWKQLPFFKIFIFVWMEVHCSAHCSIVKIVSHQSNAGRWRSVRFSPEPLSTVIVCLHSYSPKGKIIHFQFAVIGKQTLRCNSSKAATTVLRNWLQWETQDEM